MPEQRATHFWFASLMGPATGGFDVANRVGEFTATPWQTRHEVYAIIRDMLKNDPGLIKHTIISFDIQPNRLD